MLNHHWAPTDLLIQPSFFSIVTAVTGACCSAARVNMSLVLLQRVGQSFMRTGYRLSADASQQRWHILSRCLLWWLAQISTDELVLHIVANVTIIIHAATHCWGEMCQAQSCRERCFLCSTYCHEIGCDSHINSVANVRLVHPDNVISPSFISRRYCFQVSLTHPHSSHLAARM